MNDTVSIIVPNFNHAAFLPKRLDTIFQQSYSNYEVILLDDASMDNSVDILKDYALKYNHKVNHFIVNKTNSGSPFKQWKKGLDLTKGEYIWIAESDDYCELNFLEKCMSVINSDDLLSVVITDSIRTDLLSIIPLNSPFDLKPQSVILSPENFIETCPIINVSAIIMKKAVIRNDEFSKYSFIGDKVFYYQNLVGHKIAYLNLPLNYHRYHQNNVSGTRTFNRELLKYLEHLTFLKQLGNENNSLKKEIRACAIKISKKITNRVGYKGVLINPRALSTWLRLRTFT